ncbi:YggT family protein [Oleiagrimonas sp. C23AA]|uniref:YggT family protein n=1 Tax=Oleiagrimonas sp. C23AA TaxID=2719047 RepID=UPI0014205D87|nr:YggT family protein [Oleiagrimonas sp. C23AA]NII12000.1 YggT family protein [Oleiagrimonas sp. C23AA]
MSYLANAGQLLVGFIFSALIGLFVFRLLAEACRADFHNPLSQFLYRTTNPVLAPVRRAIPNWRRVNLAALLVAWVLQMLEIALNFALMGAAPAIGGLLLLGVAELADFIALVYLVLVFAWALMSMLGTSPVHPVARLLTCMVEPAVRPVRRRMPSLGGLDFSPAVVMLLLALARILLIQPLIDLGTRLALGG